MKGKAILGLTAVVMVAAALMLDAEGARMMKSHDDHLEENYRPQNFIVGGGFIPSTPGTPGFATGFGFGPSGFCTFPGSCNNNIPAAGLPTTPGGSSSSSGGGVGSQPPHP